MKNLVLLLLCCATTLVFAQKKIILEPIADDGIGFHIAANAANTNYHNDKWNIAHVQPGGLGMAMDTGRTLILFDFNSIPTNAKIKKITMSLYAYPNQAGPTYYGHGGNNNASVLQRIIQPWQPSVTTWNTRPAITTEDEVVLPQSSAPFQDYLDIDVTNLFFPMIQDKSKNFGIQMKLANEIPTNVMIFCSTNYADASKHPQLIIYYEDSSPISPTPPVVAPKDSTKTSVACESEEQIFIPNAFSPNDDGINDYFSIYSNKELKIDYLRIFDRWGNLIFEQTNSTTNNDIQGWNGTFKGQSANRDTYTYDVKITDLKGCGKTVKSDFTLIR